MANKYVFITFDGYPFALAKQLKDEGNDVIVCQIEKPQFLGVDSGLSKEESREEQKRRMSIYSGILKKIPYDKLINFLKTVQNKDEYFFFFDFNNTYKLSEEILSLGFTRGIFQTEDDFEREKDRKSSKDFVQKYFKNINVPITQEFKSVEEGIQFLQQYGGNFALKSSGNFVETCVPSSKDSEFNRNELIYKLESDEENYNKGFILEEKIIDPTEVAVEIAFWNGEPIYTSIDMETRLIAAGDIGFQTGGNQNIVMSTNMDDPINQFFPPIVYEIAKSRPGLFLFDIGLLFDKQGKPYFAEFCGNRFGWGGAFSIMSMSRSNRRCSSEYFESVVQGRNPFRYKFGAYVSLYNLQPDHDFAGLYLQDLPFQWKPVIDPVFFPYQVKTAPNNPDLNLNTGYSNPLMGYTTGFGNSFEEVSESVYQFEKKVSFSGLVYRPKEDFLSTYYVSSLPNRLKFLSRMGLINQYSPITNPNESRQEINMYAKVMGKYLNK